MKEIDHEESECNRPTDDDTPRNLVPGFVATREELFKLAKDLKKELVDYDWVYFMYGQAGGWAGEYARICRLSTISKFLGEELAAKANQKAYDELREATDRETWRIFTQGSAEEKAAVGDRNHFEMVRSDELFNGAIERFAKQEPSGLATTLLKQIGYRLDRKTFADAVHRMLDGWEKDNRTLKSILIKRAKEAGLRFDEREVYDRTTRGEDPLSVLKDICGDQSPEILRSILLDD